MDSKQGFRSDDGLYVDYRHYEAPEAVQPALEVQSSQNHAYHQFAPVRNQEWQHQPKDPIRPEARRTTVCGIPRTTFFVCLSFLATLLLAGALAGGVGGYYSHQLSDCRQKAVADRSCTTGNTSQQSPPQCEDRATWSSNLTLNTYTKICDVDLAGNIQKANIMNVVTATFDGCLYMCDTYSQVGKDSGLTVQVAVWSENGNGTGGYMNANEPGMCWCVHVNQTNYKMLRIEGAQAGLLAGTFGGVTLP